MTTDAMPRTPYACADCQVEYASFARYLTLDPCKQARYSASLNAGTSQNPERFGAGLCSVDAPQRGSGSGHGPSHAPAPDGPSEKQTALLTALGRAGFAAKGQHDEAQLAEWVAAQVALGRRHCSERIDAAKAKGLTPAWRPQTPASAAAAPSSAPAPAGPAYSPERGEVHVIDGRYLRVSVSKAGRPYTNEWDGSGWEYAPGYARRLTAETVATAEQAAAFGHLYERCVFCTRDLDLPQSIEVGYGQVCAGQRGLPWG